MIILCGASASGKTEVAKLLESKFNYKKAITNTTRPIRKGEVNDIDYHFTSKERFLELKDQDYFVETTFYNDNYYGCAKNEVQDNKCVILEPSGVSNFLKLNNPNIIVFVLTTSEDIRRQRMINRGDKEENIIQRLNKDKEHFSLDKLSFADFIISSDDKSPIEIASKIDNLYKQKIKK